MWVMEGDSCDANPTHLFTHIHSQVQAFPISVHNLLPFSLFLFFCGFFSCQPFPLGGLLFSGDSRANYRDPAVSLPPQKMPLEADE